MGLRLSRCAQCNGLLAEGEHRGTECDVCLKQFVMDRTPTRFCPKDEFEVCAQCFKCFYFESSVDFHPHSKWKEIAVRAVDDRNMNPLSGGASSFHCSYCQSRITDPLAVKCLQCKFLLHAHCFEMLKKSGDPGDRWPQNKLIASQKSVDHLSFRRPIRTWDVTSYKIMHCLADEEQQRIYVSDYLSSRILILNSKTLQPIEQWENAAANRSRFFLSVFCMTKLADRILLFDRWLDFPLQMFSKDGKFMFAGGEHLATHSASCSNIATDGTLCYLYSMRSKKLEAFDAQLQTCRQFIPHKLKEELHKLEKERYDTDKLPMLFIGRINGYGHTVLGCWIEKKRLLLIFDLKSEALVSASKLQLTESECSVSTLFVVNGVLYAVVDKTIVALHLNGERCMEEVGRLTVDECEDGIRVAATRDELICFIDSSAATRRLTISVDQPLPSIFTPKHLQRVRSDDASMPSLDLESALLAPASFSGASSTATHTATRTASAHMSSLSFPSTPTHSILDHDPKFDVRGVDEDTKTMYVPSAVTGQKSA